MISIVDKMPLDSHMPSLSPHDKEVAPKTKSHSFYHHRHPIDTAAKTSSFFTLMFSSSKTCLSKQCILTLCVMQ